MNGYNIFSYKKIFSISVFILVMSMLTEELSPSYAIPINYNQPDSQNPSDNITRHPDNNAFSDLSRNMTLLPGNGMGPNFATGNINNNSPNNVGPPPPSLTDCNANPNDPLCPQQDMNNTPNQTNQILPNPPTNTTTTSTLPTNTPPFNNSGTNTNPSVNNTITPPPPPSASNRTSSNVTSSGPSAPENSPHQQIYLQIHRQ